MNKGKEKKEGKETDKSQASEERRTVPVSKCWAKPKLKLLFSLCNTNGSIVSFGPLIIISIEMCLNEGPTLFKK